MTIQINTDRTIHGSDPLTAEIEATVRRSLSHHQDRLSRVEVHVSDENGAKSGQNDIRCAMEARPAGLQPIAVTDHAANVVQAVDGAAKKLKAALDHAFGKLHHHQT